MKKSKLAVLYKYWHVVFHEEFPSEPMTYYGLAAIFDVLTGDGPDMQQAAVFDEIFDAISDVLTGNGLDLQKYLMQYLMC